MRYFISVALLFLLLAGCSMHSVRRPMAGTWFATIDEIEVSLELVIVQGTVTGGLTLLEDPDGELEKGMVLGIIEGTCSNGEVHLIIDVDRDGKKSEEDLYMELHLEGNETLTGFGHEMDDPDDIHEIHFRR